MKCANECELAKLEKGKAFSKIVSNYPSCLCLNAHNFGQSSLLNSTIYESCLSCSLNLSQFDEYPNRRLLSIHQSVRTNLLIRAVVAVGRLKHTPYGIRWVGEGSEIIFVAASLVA
jgi:hypothetical protein